MTKKIIPQPADGELEKQNELLQSITDTEFPAIPPENEVVQELPAIPPVGMPDMAEFTKLIKAQVLEEMKNDQTRAMEESAIRRDAENEERQKYFTKMKASPDPWVEIIGWLETDKGIRVEMEWNDAFIDYLSSAGIKGTDEDQVVQRWVAMLLQNMAADMEDGLSEEKTSEFK